MFPLKKKFEIHRTFDTRIPMLISTQKIELIFNLQNMDRNLNEKKKKNHRGMKK